MTKYTITTKSAEELAEVNDLPVESFADYGGKTFSGFTKIKRGIYEGCYEGRLCEDEFDDPDVIFLPDEIKYVVVE